MLQDLFIIGATGKVGQTLIQQIYSNGDTDRNRHANPTRIVGLASSTHYLFNGEGITRRDALSFSSKQNAKTKYYWLSDLLNIIQSRHGHDDKVVFVDTTALNDPMTDFHLNVIKNSRASIITANKNPIALSPYETFAALTEEPGRYGYRCSVMAGAEAVPFMRDLKDLNDSLLSMQGCFSGTLGYITSGLEKGNDFSSIVHTARKLGYTEPDPRDDLNGLDVARKLTVLARTAGYPIGMNSIKVEPFIGKEFFKAESIDDFLSSISVLDESFRDKVNSASQRGNVLRYVAEMSTENATQHFTVSLRQVPKDGSLGALQGTSNKIVIVSETYSKEKPYSIEAPGAGLDITAQNIRRDLLYLLHGRRLRK